MAQLTALMGITASFVLLFISILDFFYQKYDYEKNLRMSKQDIKDEHKNSEGDPIIKSRIKQRQREMAMRRMMQEIPQADVVITNPTHYAIAIKYDDGNMDAPVIVAKGVDFVAQKIKMIAKENEIVMVENRPLARSLYDEVEIGDRIPEEFFKAIAEILAYVYRIINAKYWIAWTLVEAILIKESGDDMQIKDIGVLAAVIMIVAMLVIPLPTGF